MAKEKDITPRFKGCINAYEARKDGSQDLHMELDKVGKPITDEHGNFYIRVEPHEVERFMYAAIDALQKKRGTR
jgi:hypothetical protein